MSIHYKAFMEVLKRWPVDASKGSRDYGLHLRNLANTSLPPGEIFPGNDQMERTEKFNALFRIAENKYKKMYASSRTTAATGLSHEQLHHAMSEEFVNKHLR